MTELLDTGRVNGSIFSVEALQSLPSDDCNVLLVSSRTLHLLHEIQNNEVHFLARYASTFEQGGRYFPVSDDVPAEVDLVADVARNFSLEVQNMTAGIIDVLQGIQDAILNAGTASGCCTAVGNTLESEPGVPDEDPPTGFGEPDPAVVDRLCKAANAIFDSILATIEALIASPAEEFLVIGFSLVASLVTAVIGAAFIPVIGLLLVGTAVAVIGIATALLAAGIDLPTLKTQFEANRNEVVCALVQSSGATHAREQLIVALSDAGVSLVNQALVAAMLPNDVLNMLWFSNEGTEAFLSDFVVTDDCSSCNPDCELFVCGVNPGGVPPTCEYLGDGRYRLTSGTRSDGDQGISITWNVDDPVTDDCGPMLQIQFESGPTTGYKGSTGVRIWIDGPAGWEDRTVSFSSSIVWSSFEDARVLALIREGVQFQITIVTIPL